MFPRGSRIFGPCLRREHPITSVVTPPLYLFISSFSHFSMCGSLFLISQVACLTYIHRTIPGHSRRGLGDLCVRLARTLPLLLHLSRNILHHLSTCPAVAVYPVRKSAIKLGLEFVTKEGGRGKTERERERERERDEKKKRKEKKTEKKLVPYFS